ncbi:hypothetical protein G4B88_017054 [Cannabis sativa]|uniref:Uncharacterized protein n=1 Tax=Cannabis sativa TaxID=3483 RepID=A0A7J6GZ41_CANSA|nr:hypothetical protein G4B88_017054 [Cannabis sativa]
MNLQKNQVRINSEGQKKIKLLSDKVLNDPNDKEIRNESIGLKEIRKKVSRWSYKLINSFELADGPIEEMLGRTPEIRSRKCKRVVIFNHDLRNTNISSNTSNNPQEITKNIKNNDDYEEPNVISLIRFSQQSDFCRDIIIGSMRAQSVKRLFGNAFKRIVITPFFLDRIDKDFFSFPRRSYKNPISTNETNPNITQFISTIKKSISNLNKSVFQYQYKGTSLFLKNGIKDYFVGTQEIFNSELRYRNPSNYGINQWKNWLKGYYQYDLSQSKLIPPKSRNIIRRPHLFMNFHYKKIIIKRSFIITKKNKQKIYNMLIDIPINNYRVEENIIDIKTNPDKKVFDVIILNYCLRNKIYIGAWVDIDTHPKSNKYTKTWSNNYQLIEKIDKKGLVYPTLHQNQEINPYPIWSFGFCWNFRYFIINIRLNHAQYQLNCSF